jgi:hypothetical protein
MSDLSLDPACSVVVRGALLFVAYGPPNSVHELRHTLLRLPPA